MATGYHGKWKDLFFNLNVGQSVFVKCLTDQDRKTLSSRMDYYSKMFKRKFTSAKFENQTKVTRVS